MAAITLPGFTFGSALGMGAFEGIGTAFTGAKSSSSGLSEALGALKSKIDLAAVAAKVETAQEQEKKAEEREFTKKSSLSLAYDKLDTLISDVGSIDLKVSKKIKERKDNFYSQYSYLKPECEKSTGEKIKDTLKKGWDGLCSIGNAIKNFAIDVAEWVKEHWVAIVTAIVVIVIAVVAAVFLGPAAVAAICSLVAFLCSVADTVTEIVTGKDIYTLLKDSGHPVLAEIFGGVKWGSTISAMVLNFGQLFTQIHKVGFPNFMKTLTGGEGFKGFLKGMWNGVKKDFTSVFGKGKSMGQRVKAVWNIVVLNQDGEFGFKQSINAYRNGGEKIITAVNTIGFDDDSGKYIAKSDFAKDALESRGYSADIIETKKNSFAFDQSLDYDWEHYGAQKVAEVNVMEMYNNGEISYKPDGTVNNGKLREAIWKAAGVKAPDGMSLHEMYEMSNGKITVTIMDEVLHSKRVFGHNGGVSHAANIINTINSGTFAQTEKRLAIEGFTRIVPDIVWNLGNQFYAWAH